MTPDEIAKLYTLDVISREEARRLLGLEGVSRVQKWEYIWEVPPDVKAVRDSEGDVLRRQPGGYWQYDKHGLNHLMEEYELAARLSPFTEVVG